VPVSFRDDLATSRSFEVIVIYILLRLNFFHFYQFGVFMDVAMTRPLATRV